MTKRTPRRTAAAALAAATLLCIGLGARQAACRELPLSEAIRLARARNEDFALSAEQLRQARLARDKAWAALLPSLFATGTYTRADREIVFTSTASSGSDADQQTMTRVIQRRDALAGSITATVQLFKGTAIPDVLTASRRAAAAEQEARWRQNALAFDVASAYYAALAANNLVLAAERSVATAEEHLAAVRARREAGEAIAVDETRARIDFVSARADLIKARSALASSLDYLAYLIGEEDPPRPEQLAAPPPAPPKLQETREQDDGEKNAALPSRADLQALQLEAQAARRALTGAWMDYLPSLSLSGVYRASQNTGFAGRVGSWYVALTLDWLLFDGGLRRAVRLQRASELRAAELRRRQLERDMRREVRQARRDIETASATLLAAAERLGLARESRQLVLERYRVGLATSLELTESEDALRQAEVARVGHDLELALRGLALLQTLGLDPEGQPLPAPGARRKGAQ